MDCLHQITCWLPENPSKTIQKSMKNQCKIDARKSDAKMMKKERKWSPNGSQNPLKIHKNREKRGSQIDAKKDDSAHSFSRKTRGKVGPKDNLNSKKPTANNLQETYLQRPNKYCGGKFQENCTKSECKEECKVKCKVECR